MIIKSSESKTFRFKDWVKTFVLRRFKPNKDRVGHRKLRMRLRLHRDCDRILIQESFNLLTLIKLAFEHSFNYLSYLSFLATLTAFLSCWYTKSYPSS